MQPRDEVEFVKWECFFFSLIFACTKFITAPGYRSDFVSTKTSEANSTDGLRSSGKINYVSPLNYWWERGQRDSRRAGFPSFLWCARHQLFRKKSLGRLCPTYTNFGKLIDSISMRPWASLHVPSMLRSATSCLPARAGSCLPARVFKYLCCD